MPNTYFIYARKSTESEDRQARSISDQLAELRELAERHNLEIVDVLTESQSAKKPGRPIFNDMLARLERGEAHGILAWHPDRLSRNPLDAGRLMWLTDVGKIGDLKFANYTFEATSAGKLMLAIAFGMSKYYIDRLSEDIKRGVRQKLKNGIWPRLAPVGYLNDRITRTLIPDPVRGPLVRKAFEFYAAGGYTLAKLRETVNKLGLTGMHTQLSTSNYQHMLNNPLYYGIIRYNGEFHPGKHEPLITKTLFDACQRVMQQRLRPKESGFKPYLYRGVFHCGECGCLITTETQKGHDYLRCTKRKGPCSQRYVRAEAVHEQIQAAISSCSMGEADADWLIAEIEKERSHDLVAHKEVASSMRARIAGVTAKLDRLMTAYLEQTLTLDEYKLAKNELIADRKGLEQQAIQIEKHRLSWFEPAIRLINRSKQATFLLENENPTDSLEFFRKAGSNRKITNKRVGWEPRGAWKHVVNAGRFAQHDIAAPVADAAMVGEPDQRCQMRRR
jgi:site-specific DNA recombinase